MWPTRSIGYSLFIVVLVATGLAAQNATGELRLSVTDTTGLPIRTTLELTSESNQFHRQLQTDAVGRVVAVRLPDGVYRVDVHEAGFAAFSELVDIRSTVPRELRVVLQVAPVQSAVTVTANDTLVDPHQTGTISRIGEDTLALRATALPGRALVDLVSTQPGWLLEANGILHPRGSEYQTQYVIDGVPLTDNRSPAFLPDFDAENVQSLRVMTASYPAEYGRKLGGVVDVVTKAQAERGLRGSATAYGGSFATLGGSIVAGYRGDRYAVSASGDAGRTDHFLDPPVTANYTNEGRTAGVYVQAETAATERDRFGATLRHAVTRFLVPNEQVQEAAGERQDRHNSESAAQFSYQRIASPSVVADVRGLFREISATLISNAQSTPIVASQNRHYGERYVKATLSAHAGAHDVKTGVEADFATIDEQFGYRITDRSRFDRNTPDTFDFAARASDHEQAIFVQDLVRAGNWTFTGGLRWDRYDLLVTETAWSPRAGAAYYWPGADLVFRAAYDRVFQTPAFENLLIASSPEVDALSDQTLRLPVRPSRGNFFEAGVTKSLLRALRFNINVYRRDFTNFADDDLLLNTGVSFPIAFRRASIHGVEAKLDVPHWRRLSGSLSYSNMRGTGHLPITGGLFLGDAASVALLETAGVFPISQDQRHTLNTRWRAQYGGAWAGAAASFGSGLPTETDEGVEDALAAYGSEIVERVDFNGRRVRPSVSLDLAGGVALRKASHRSVRVQIDVTNVTNRLNVINFVGLFSGTAVGSPRRATVRLHVDF